MNHTTANKSSTVHSTVLDVFTPERAREIVEGKQPTKAETDSLGITRRKGWLRQLRRRLANKFGIVTARYGPILVDGILTRGAGKGLTLEEASDSTIASLNGCLTGSDLALIRREMDRRKSRHEWVVEGGVSAKAVQTCLSKGMTPEAICSWFHTKGKDVSLSFVLRIAEQKQST